MKAVTIAWHVTKAVFSYFMWNDYESGPKNRLMFQFYEFRALLQYFRFLFINNIWP